MKKRKEKKRSLERQDSVIFQQNCGLGGEVASGDNVLLGGSIDAVFLGVPGTGFRVHHTDSKHRSQDPEHSVVHPSQADVALPEVRLG